MMNFINRNKYAVIFCALLLAGGYGGYKYYVASKTPAQTVKTGVVERGNLIETISATGALSAVNNVDISSKITGRIVEVLVQENQHVNAGDVMVRLDDTALMATMRQMKAKLDNAEANYNRYQKLVESGAISRSEFDNVYADYLVAKTNFEKAASDVQDTVITTPIDGYVIGEPTPVGQTISSGISEPQVIMSVATLDDMQIEAMVDESDIGQVKVGQKVNFAVDAYPNETFTGKVRLISRKAETSNNVIYYKVYVDVDDAKGKLLPTMTARADFIIASAEDVLMVPLNCVYVEGKRRFVKVYNTKTKESRDVDVKLGLSNDSEIVVQTDALKPGEVLLVRKAVAKQTGVRTGGGMMRPH